MSKKTEEPKELNDAFGVGLMAIVALGYFLYSMNDGKIYTRRAVEGYVMADSALFWWIGISNIVFLTAALVYLLIKRKI